MKNNRLVFWSLTLVLIIASSLIIDLRYSAISDSLLKTIQSYSILKNHFASEELFYPARQIDPDFTHFLFRPPFLVTIGERHLSQYPVLLSVLMTPYLATFGPSLLSIFSITWLIGIIYILKNYWKLSNYTLFFAIFGTYLFPLSLDISENSLMVFLNLIGTTLILRSLENQKIRGLVLGGLAGGASIWLRLEAIPYMAILLLSVIFVSGANKAQSLKSALIVGFAFLIPAFLFAGFNIWNYGHFLGPRFSENYVLHENFVAEQIRRFLVLAFFGNFKIGFFLYIPLFLISGLYFAFPANYRSLPRNFKILLWTGFGFILAAGLLAPNDGATNAGPRYMELSIFPLLMVTTRFWAQITQKERSAFLRFANKGAILFSFLITTLTLSVFTLAVKQLKDYQAFFTSANADIWAFDQTTCGFNGNHYFKTPSLCIYTESIPKDLVKRLKLHFHNKTIAYFRLTAKKEDRIESDFKNSFPVLQNAKKGNLVFTVYKITN